MTGLSSAGEALVLASLTGNFMVSLHTSDPGDTGANEVTNDPSYSRQGPVSFTNTGNNPTIASNNSIVPFGTANAAWGTVSFFGCWTQVIGGSFYGSGPLDTPRQVLSGDTVRFLTGALQLSAN